MSEDQKDPKWGPAFFYGPDGEAEVFNAAEDVPEGWQDHPFKVEDPKEAVAPPELPPLTRKQIMAELTERKVGYDVTQNTKSLYELLVSEIDKTA